MAQPKVRKDQAAAFSGCGRAAIRLPYRGSPIRTSGQRWRSNLSMKSSTSACPIGRRGSIDRTARTECISMMSAFSPLVSGAIQMLPSCSGAQVPFPALFGPLQREADPWRSSAVKHRLASQPMHTPGALVR